MTAQPRDAAAIAWRAGLVIVGIGVGLVVAWALRSLLLQVFLAVILAAGLLAPVNSLERRLPRAAAVILAVLAVIGLVVLILVLVLPPLVSQIVAFFAALPELVAQLQASLAEVVGTEVVESWFGTEPPALPELSDLVAAGISLFDAVFAGVTVLIFTIMMLLDRDRISHWFANFLRPADRDRGLALGESAILRLGGYIRGLLVTMSFEGIGVAVGAFVLGMPYALALGALTFLAAAIPYLGTVLMILPAAIIGLTVSPITALLIVVWIIVLEQIEGLIVTPVVQSHAVQISPMAVMFGVLAGLTLAGVVGGLVAIPIVAIIDLLLREIFFPMWARSGSDVPVTSAAVAEDPAEGIAS